MTRLMRATASVWTMGVSLVVLALFLSATLGFVLLLAGTALADPPSISYCLPAAAAPGRATDIKIFGGNLAGATGFWSTLPTATCALTPGVEQNGAKADQVTYRLTLPPEVPVGIYGARLATTEGVSNVRLLMVDDLASVTDNGANKTVATAQELSLPVAVDGFCEAESFDFYKFNAVAGQRVSLECVARRLGSQLDPVIRLLDSAGHELAYSDDEPGIGADCRLAYRIKQTGMYFVEIRDIRYMGDANHRYHLRIGDFPLATTTYPMAGNKQATSRLVFCGPDADGLPPLNLVAAASVPGDQLPLSAKYADGQGSAFVRAAASRLSEQIELEPNDTPEKSSPLNVPGAINGRFEKANDRDYFQFDAKKGQRLIFTGRTRSLGSPSDLFMRVLKADGGLLAEAEDSGVDEGVIDVTIPADGSYRLMVEDLLRRGGPDHVYRVAVEPYAAGFSLVIDTERFNAPKSGVFVAKVTCTRRDYNGPIALSLEGAGDGLALAGNTLGEGAKETVLNVTLPPSVEPGRLMNVRVVGRAKIGDAEFQTTASTLGVLRTAFSGLEYPPADLDGAIGLGAGPLFPEFFELAAAPAIVPYAQIVGGGTFKIQAKRLNKFDDKVNLAVEGLPPGVTAKVAAIDKGKGEVDVELSGVAALAEGEHVFRVVGTATYQNQPKRVILDKIVLRVVKPVQVVITPVGALSVGGKQSIKVQLTRYGDAKGPVVVRFKQLPLGVTGPAELTIAEGKNEGAFELAAAANALPGKTLLAATATASVKDRAVTVDSEPMALEINKP